MNKSLFYKKTEKGKKSDSSRTQKVSGIRGSHVCFYKDANNFCTVVSSKNLR